MSLSDELSKKQTYIFQLNEFNPKFIDSTLDRNIEGIFNLPSKIHDSDKKNIVAYLFKNHDSYDFELKNEVTTSRIYFKYRSFA